MMASPDRRRKRLDRSIEVRSAGLYALSSYREMTYVLAPRLLLIVGLLILPFILDPYWQKVLCAAAITAILALSFDFLAQYVGLVCLGGAMFIGFGGYIAGLMNTNWGLPPMLTIPLAAVIGSFVSTLVLLPCLRLRGIYFAIVTFMLPLFARNVIVALGLFGSTEGITGLDTLPNTWAEQYIMMGIKDNDQAVLAAGISILRYRVIAVFVASFIACFAGAYLAHLYGWLGLSLFAMDFSILPIAATVMGGMGTLSGAVIGALILTPLSEALRGFGQLRVVLYCLVLLIFILYKPEGLMNYLERKYHQFERWEKV
jgi:branched-chain amino acid transport system permease protein